jgi:hypothetical protein
VREGTIVSFLQAQAAPAPPCDRSQRRHARLPLTDKLAEELERLPEDRDAFDAGALDACLPELSADPSIDSDLDPSAALLLRVEPAGAELRLDQGIGAGGQEGVTKGPAVQRERLLALRAAALAVGSESHLNFSKNPAADSRPSALSQSFDSTPPQAPRRRELATQTTQSPSPWGEAQPTHEE